MKKPNKISKDQLKHPRDKRSAFNGDKIRNEGSFNTRISITEGTRKPQGLREVLAAQLLPDGSVRHGKDIAGGVQPIPQNHTFQTFTRPSERQQQMRKKGRK